MSSKRGPPSWLFSNNTSITPRSVAFTDHKLHNMGKKTKREKTPDVRSRKGPVPPARLLQLVSKFLTEHSCVKAHRALLKDINDNGWDTELSYGDQSLTSIFQSWETAQNSAVASVDDPASVSSSDTDTDSSESESDSSNSRVKLALGADLVAAGTKSLKRKATRNSSSATSNSATSNSVLDSSSEAEPTSKKRKTAGAAQGSESSESDSDSGSSETSGSDESSSDSDNSDDSDSRSDDSDSNSEQAGRTGANVAGSSSEEESLSEEGSSSEDDSSDSDSDSGGEIAAKAAAGISIPESDSDDTSDSSSSDSGVEDKKKTQKRKKTSAAASRVSSDSSVTVGRQSPVSQVKQGAPPLPPDPVMKGAKKQNDPFSRIPKNIKVDPKFASNNYISVDYSQQAHEDLIVTKGKGFTKEKNKKKKGSFRGGPIDISHSGSIYFDD